MRMCLNMWYKRKSSSLPEFEPSPYWGKPLLVKQAQSSIVNLVNPNAVSQEEYDNELAKLSLFHGNVANLFLTHNVGKNLMGFDSLYLSPDGEYFLIPSHSHDEVSRKVLRSINPELPACKENCKYQKGGGYTHSDLTQVTGIQRVQIYNDGMGITIEMSNPPNIKQLNAIRDAYEMTSQDRFVAEINYDGKLIKHLKSFKELVSFVNNFDPEQFEIG